MGYEQVEDLEPFCFLAKAVPGQQNQWGQSHRQSSHAHQQPRDHCLKDGDQYSTGERQLFRGAIPPTSDPPGTSGGDQGHGCQTRPPRLPYAALRNEICRPRAECYEAQYRKHQVIHLKRKAAQLGFQIIEVPAAA